MEIFRVTKRVIRVIYLPTYYISPPDPASSVPRRLPSTDLLLDLFLQRVRIRNETIQN